MLKNIIKTLKINHYIKNLIVVFPLIFSMNYDKLDLCIKCFIIFIAFCLISSCVYILNDLIDIEKDKLHPIKKNRPIASGVFPKNLAIVILVLLLIISSFLAFTLNILCFLMIVSYFILNVFYSLFLKNIPLIDASCIAFGFIFRIIAGCFAIKVIPSPLVVLLTFFLSMFFTYTKRKLEFQLLENIENCRKSIKNFNLEIFNQFILINAILSISFYIAYIINITSFGKAATYLYLTSIPFTLIIFRLLFLINTSKIKDDPIIYIENDATLKYLFIFYLITTIVTIKF